MGIDINTAQFLIRERRRGVCFHRTLMLGHQRAYIDPTAYERLLTTLGVCVAEPYYADDLFRALGAEELTVMDASDYEGATLIQDLNLPLAVEGAARYDCVFDGGTLEHVFNFPQALRNCMELVRPGGHLVLITPMNSYCGHGFYQFSPELFHAALSPDNGYQLERMHFFCRGHWYSVRSPAIVGTRVELMGRDPLLLCISARRVGQRSIFAAWPQQTDYAAAWKNTNEGVAQSEAVEPAWKTGLICWLPGAAWLQARWRELKYRRRLSPANRQWFDVVSESEE